MNNMGRLFLILNRYYYSFLSHLRTRYYGCVLGHMGRGCRIFDNVLMTGLPNILLGDAVIINNGVILQVL